MCCRTTDSLTLIVLLVSKVVTLCDVRRLLLNVSWVAGPTVTGGTQTASCSSNGVL